MKYGELVGQINSEDKREPNHKSEAQKREFLELHHFPWML